MSAKSDVKKLIRELTARGWIVERCTGSGHIKMVFTNGQVIIMPRTPSDARWIKNCRADIVRAEAGRGYGYQRQQERVHL